MYDYIIGEIKYFEKNKIVIETNGIGYLIHIPTLDLEEFKEGKIIKLFVKIYIKDENIKLYGFKNKSEREFFEKLQSISGIGPSMALNIISSLPLENLYKAILEENTNILKNIKGVGAKTAKRIIFELKNIIKDISLPSIPTIRNKEQEQIMEAAVKALIKLGYNNQQAWITISKIIENTPNISLEDLIKEALKKMQE